MERKSKRSTKVDKIYSKLQRDGLSVTAIQDKIKEIYDRIDQSDSKKYQKKVSKQRISKRRISRNSVTVDAMKNANNK
jgi:hypothetical protein